jgi:hypothetical protein
LIGNQQVYPHRTRCIGAWAVLPLRSARIDRELRWGPFLRTPSPVPPALGFCPRGGYDVWAPTPALILRNSTFRSQAEAVPDTSLRHSGSLAERVSHGLFPASSERPNPILAGALLLPLPASGRGRPASGAMGLRSPMPCGPAHPSDLPWRVPLRHVIGRSGAFSMG